MTYTGRADKDREALTTQFEFHPATDVTKPMHEETRHLHRVMALWILDNVPASAERKAALQCLQQSMMWCNAAIAIHVEHEVEMGRISTS
jgi:hypothetical protein